MPANIFNVTKIIQPCIAAPAPLPDSSPHTIINTSANHKLYITHQISEKIFQDVNLFYHCCKFSARYLIRYYKNITPNRVIRLILIGYYNEEFESPWLCTEYLNFTKLNQKKLDLE
ncbi:MAG: hypothetical protein IPM96_06315 [Ignavibacteria bacterium]|nr:hypothetical protein [Ignavibacteria bacterium]